MRTGPPAELNPASATRSPLSTTGESLGSGHFQLHTPVPFRTKLASTRPARVRPIRPSLAKAPRPHGGLLHCVGPELQTWPSLEEAIQFGPLSVNTRFDTLRSPCLESGMAPAPVRACVPLCPPVSRCPGRLARWSEITVLSRRFKTRAFNSRPAGTAETPLRLL